MSDTSAVVLPQICPYAYYHDAAAAIDFLTTAFGFRERLRVTNDDGTITHAELEIGSGVVMLGGGMPDGMKNPAELGQVTVGMYVQVPDVEAHYRQAKAAGATLQGEPKDQTYGVRSYGALDGEGHQWWFWS